MKINGRCPCCKEEVVVEHKPAKWQGEEPKVIIEHKKWQDSWK